MEFKKRKERQERKERTGQGSLMDAMTIDYEQASNSIVNFIRQKVAEAGKDGICMGISGGLDSTVVAILAVKAMGDPSKVYGLHLSDRDSQKKFSQFAQRVADELGINFEMRDISALVKEQGTYKPAIMRIIPFLSGLNKLSVFSSKVVYSLVFRESPFVLTLKKGEPAKNKLTRIIYSALSGTIEESFNVRHIRRRKILEKFAAERNLILIGAANRSESFVGWFVKDGIDDLPIEALLGLYKNQVRQLARFLGVPAEILGEAPSPDMFKGIRDEDIIGYSYEKIDKVAYVFEHDLSEEVAFNDGITPKEFDHIKTLNLLSAWKRGNKHEFPSFE